MACVNSKSKMCLAHSRPNKLPELEIKSLKGVGVGKTIKDTEPEFPGFCFIPLVYQATESNLFAGGLTEKGSICFIFRREKIFQELKFIMSL